MRSADGSLFRHQCAPHNLDQVQVSNQCCLSLHLLALRPKNSTLALRAPNAVPPADAGPQANVSTEEVTLWDNFIEPELVEQARLLTMLSLRLSRAVACLLRATLGPAAYVGGLPRTRPVYPRQRTIR